MSQLDVVIEKKLDKIEADQRIKKHGEVQPVGDIPIEQWQRMLAQARIWWSLLTEADLLKAAGRAKALIQLLEDKYAFNYDQAKVEFKRRISEFEALPHV